MWGHETNFTRRKNVTRLASLLLRECFGPFGKAQRRALIDNRWRFLSHKKRTKVIQIAVTLNNESHNRLVNFHAIYRLYHTVYAKIARKPSHILFLQLRFRFYKIEFFHFSSTKARSRTIICRKFIMSDIKCLRAQLSLKLNLCQGKVRG